MRRLICVLAASAASVIALAGCSALADPHEPAVDSLVQEAEQPEASNLKEDGVRVAGEVCDPSNANDAICAVSPAAAAENMFERLPPEISGLPGDQRTQLAVDACSVLAAGDTPSENVLASSPTVDAQFGPGTTNELLYAVAGYGFCQDQLAAVDPIDAWLIDHYAELGEDASIAEFADGTMPELPTDLTPQLPAGVSPESVS